MRLFNARKIKVILLIWIAASRYALASEHPGNVHVQGEIVHVSVPQSWIGWHAIDIDGVEVARGTSQGDVADLGKLPIGYYEVLENDGPGLVTAGVLATTEPSDNTPIALDTAISWFYSEPEQIRDACKLCRLAGVKWVRDRSSWPEIQIAQDTWAEDGRYERAMRLERDEGLKVLQVNHISPSWATENAARFPEDLRVVYKFYRGLAARWNGLVDAIEPWNEPDIRLFGGHTGCEIASFQKAAYLGLKAGNPEQPVCSSCFAIDRAETLDEFAANKVFPYFDRYDLHHYIALPAYSRAYGRHRAVSGGRPMWTTEFNLPVHWEDEATKEPSYEELRAQAYRVGKVFAMALHEGSEKAFYFILGDYVERNLQYGLVHKDLTPRPAYVAFAAVGRFLNGAKPIGRVNFGNDKLFGYAFETFVDGTKQETIVAWSETSPRVVKVQSAKKAYDFLGREQANPHNVELTRKTIFMILSPGGSKLLDIEPPPVQPEWQPGKACPVVLQIIGNGDVDKSAFRLDDSNELRLVAYNFSDRAIHGKLQVEGATGVPGTVRLAPHERKELTMKVGRSGNTTARLHLNQSEMAIVSTHTLKQSATTRLQQ